MGDRCSEVTAEGVLCSSAAVSAGSHVDRRRFLRSRFRPTVSFPAATADPLYDEAMRYLYGRINYERAPDAAGSLKDFKLSRMEQLLRLAGNPQHRLPTIHITGTKGKGSTATMTARIAQAAGYRVGLFTSPHVHRFEERMTVNGIMPPSAKIVTLVDRLRPIVDQLESQGLEPTFFELATALGWLHFLEERVDLAVVEVGLGGRLDSTNVCRPFATAITSISRDHTRLLGDTLEQIAFEKAGITKPGVPMVSGVTEPGPARVIAQIAESCNAPLLVIDRDFSAEIEPAGEPPYPEPTCESVNVRVGDKLYGNLKLAMPGRHQVRNAAVAVCLASLMENRFPGVNDAAVRNGLRSAVCPLRVEIIGRTPLVIVDAAHNPASIKALCDTLGSVSAERRIAVFASSRDKETRENLRILGDHFDQVILTRYLSNPRAMTETELSTIARESLRCPWHWTDTPQSAWQLVEQSASVHDLICFTGSFFLAAEAQELIAAR